MVKKEVVILVPDEIISNQIYLIRNQKVMLDKDLAKLYEVDTKVLKQAVRRNIDRFPNDFMFELTKPRKRFFKASICALKERRTYKISTYGFYRNKV